MDTTNPEPEHHIPYRIYVNVWLALVALTVVTVGASYAHLGHIAVLTAILIAAVKGSLVVLYFMHLRYERPLFAYMIIATFGTFAIFLALTFADYWAR